MTIDERPRPSAYPAIAVSVLLLVVYTFLAARALNLDGLGYADVVKSSDPKKLLLPGHLFYGPLMLALCKAVAVIAPSVPVERVMQFSDAVFGAVGVGVFIHALRMLRVSSFVAVCAGLGLAFSFTYWVHSTDLTTYALSTLLLIGAFYVLCKARHAGRGAPVYALALTVALATLVHQSNILFLPAAIVGVILIARNGWLLSAVEFTAACLAFVLIPYAVLGSIAVGSPAPAAVMRWAAVSTHGYSPGFETMNLARGAYGLANAVVFMDDVGTAVKGEAANVAGSSASARRMGVFAAKSAFLLAVLFLAMATFIRRRSNESPQDNWALYVCAVWALPYGMFALLYFTTDHDRWILLLPALWAAFALAFRNPSGMERQALGAVAVVLCVLNLTAFVYPAHFGANNRYYLESRALGPRLALGDLVLFWGHDHIGTPGYLRQSQHADAWHVFDLVRRSGKETGLRDLTRMVDSALSANRRVLVVGIYGAGDAASDYRAEAHQLDLSRSDVVAALGRCEASRLPGVRGCEVYRVLRRGPVPQPAEER